MEFRHLRYFVAVADELHFGRAAKRLGIAQPPLSQQIQRLEHTLGVQLFERNRRGVKLTAAGMALLPEARDILDRMERAVTLVQRSGSGDSGCLILGFVGSATLSMLPEVLLSFREQYPDVELELREMSTEQQVNTLNDSGIHAGLARVPIIEPPLASVLVARDPLILALPDALGRNMPNPVSLSIVADAPFIVSPRHLGHGFYDLVIALCEGAGFEPRIVQEAVQMQTIVGLVAAGIGVALVPASMERLQREGVVYRHLTQPDAATELSLIWREDMSFPPVNNLIALIETRTRMIASE